jgi:Domain of unknown function (DUF929)
VAKTSRRPAARGTAARRSSLRRLSKRPVWQSPSVLISAAVAVVAVALVAIVVVNQLGGNSTAAGGNVSQPVSQTVATAIESTGSGIADTVGTGGQPGSLTRLSGSTVLRGSDGKPLVVFVGAEYCPYCAAERWVIVNWLSRFGQFQNLTEIESSSTDVFPDTNTFSFHGASYSSAYLDFSSAELYDRSGNSLETPSAQVSSVFQTVDQPPYTSQKLGFPFIDIAGLYTLYNTSYSPQLLQGLSWDQIAAKLSNPNDPVTKAIIGNANYMTAATCIATGNQPASACSSPTISSIEKTLESQTPVS